jgi:cobalt-precorrin 5A hydrolase
MTGRRNFAIYAITRHGVEIAARLRSALGEADVFVSQRVRETAGFPCLELPLPMGPTLRRTWAEYDCHVHVISVGAVVRMLAPLIEDKKTDPAVVCVDDAGRFAVALLSGHVGRGNAFTERVAAALGAQSVVTTASDVQGTLTVDILGRELGWVLDHPDRNVTAGCAAVVNEEPVLVVQETGSADWWPAGRALPPGVHLAHSLEGVDPAAWSMLLVVSDRDLRRSHPGHYHRSVVYRPPSLVLGVGCDRGTPLEVLAHGVDEVLAEHQLCERSVYALATIDLKADEPAIVELCRQRRWELRLFSAAELDAVAGIQNPSEVARRHVGTRSVAEAACLLAAGASELCVAKRKYARTDHRHNVTVAVARRPGTSKQEVQHVAR